MTSERPKANTKPKIMRHFISGSIEGGKANRRNPARSLPDIEAKGAAYRRVRNIDQLNIQPQVPCVPWLVITTDDEFMRMMAEFAEYVGGGGV